MHDHSLAKIKRYLIIHGHSDSEVNEAISQVSKDYEKNKIGV